MLLLDRARLRDALRAGRGAWAVSPEAELWARVWARLRQRLSEYGLPLAFLLGAVVVWWRSLAQIDLDGLSDIGLISVLPWSFYVSFALLTIGFCLALALPRLSVPLLLQFVLTAVLILYGTACIIEPIPRGATVWRHLGVSDYLAHHLVPNPELDAYFSWPGVFYVIALFTKLGGLPAAMGLARWTPLALDLAYLAPLVVILRVATRDERLVWLAAWFFTLSNWVDQDYLAPQGVCYLLFLIVLAILLKHFKTEQPEEPLPLHPARGGLRARWRMFNALPRPETPNPPLTARRRAALMAVVGLLFVFVAASHQLTPFAITAVVTGLVVTRRLNAPLLPVFMVTVVAGWLVFMASGFLSGHTSMITDSLGHLTGNLGTNVANRLAGSPAHVFVVRSRLVMTLAIWMLAGLGVLRRLAARRFDLSLGVMAATPFCLLVQAYGGEMILRVYFFALPAMAFFAAALFFAHHREVVPTFKLAALAVCSLALFGGFLLARYGNERMDYFSPDEISGSFAFYRLAPPGSVLISASPTALRFQDYDSYEYDDIQDEANILLHADARKLAADSRKLSQNGKRQVFFLFTRTQAAQIDLFSGLPEGSLSRLLAAVEASPDFTVVYYSKDAEIFTFPRLDQPAEDAASETVDASIPASAALTAATRTDTGALLSSSAEPLPPAPAAGIPRPSSPAAGSVVRAGAFAEAPANPDHAPVSGQPSEGAAQGERTTALTDAQAVAAFGSVRRWAAAHNAAIAGGAPGNYVDPETGM